MAPFEVDQCPTLQGGGVGACRGVGSLVTVSGWSVGGPENGSVTATDRYHATYTAPANPPPSGPNVTITVKVSGSVKATLSASITVIGSTIHVDAKYHAAPGAICNLAQVDEIDDSFSCDVDLDRATVSSINNDTTMTMGMVHAPNLCPDQFLGV